MNDLIAFLNARLDEDEETARATSRPAWRKWGIEPWYDGEFLNDGRTERADLWGAAGAGLFTAQGALATVMADHIARHDPARALREVEATRSDIALCAELAAEYERIRHGADMMRRDALLKVLRHRAAVWDDHPDYRAEWKP